MSNWCQKKKKYLNQNKHKWLFANKVEGPLFNTSIADNLGWIAIYLCIETMLRLLNTSKNILIINGNKSCVINSFRKRIRLGWVGSWWILFLKNFEFVASLLDHVMVMTFEFLIKTGAMACNVLYIFYVWMLRRLSPPFFSP